MANRAGILKDLLVLCLPSKVFLSTPVFVNKANAMYGMMGKVNGTDDLEEIVLDFLDNINSVH